MGDVITHIAAIAAVREPVLRRYAAGLQFIIEEQETGDGAVQRAVFVKYADGTLVPLAEHFRDIWPALHNPVQAAIARNHAAAAAANALRPEEPPADLDDTAASTVQVMIARNHRAAAAPNALRRGTKTGS